MSHACHGFWKYYKTLAFCSLLTRCAIPCACHAKRDLNVQKWSIHGVFCTFWLWNVLRATTACTFSTSQLRKVVRTWCVLYIWLRNVLRATTACNFSSLIWPDGSAPAALASLLFDPPEPQIIGKTQCFATFLPFRASASSFFWLFLFSDLLSSTLLFSLTLPISAFHLSILSEVWLRSLMGILNHYVCKLNPHYCLSDIPNCHWWEYWITMFVNWIPIIAYVIFPTIIDGKIESLCL